MASARQQRVTLSCKTIGVGGKVPRHGEARIEVQDDVRIIKKCARVTYSRLLREGETP